jgi:hypothetical protein
MRKKNLIRQALFEYAPHFIVEKIEYIRMDTGSYVFDIYGNMTKESSLYVYPFSSIITIVKDKTVIKYRAFISPDFFQTNITM